MFYVQVFSLLIISILFGSMMFFSFILTPLIFLKLDKTISGPFIRSIFPWYYAVIFILSTLSLLLFLNNDLINASISGTIAIGAVFSRQIIIPKLNRYRDKSLAEDKHAKNKFDHLHRFSVLLNSLQIIGVSIILIRLV